MRKDFGVIETTTGNRIVGFHEKKADAPTMPGDPDRVYASMGNYIFSTDMLLKLAGGGPAGCEQQPRLRLRHPAEGDEPRRDVRL